MAAQACARLPQRTVGKQPRLAIAEMKLALGEAGGMAEQPGHAVAHTVSVLEALAEHHVPAALAVHRARRGEAREARAERFCGGEPSGVQLGVTARQPAAIALLRRRLAGKR